MAVANDGGSAFPVVPPTDQNGFGSANGYPFPESGMTLRDWFAGQALVGCYATIKGVLATSDQDLEMDAQLFYRIADAMISARDK